MESKKEYFERETKQCRYDKRLILDVVKLIEEGMSRKEANQRYNLGASTLDGWMRDYGSKAYHERKRKNLSSLEKRKIIAEVEQGRLTVKEAQIKYNVKSVKTIHNLLYQSRQENLNFYPSIEPDMAKPKRKYLSSNTSSPTLQKALEEAQLKIEALNTMIDVAEEQLKIDIRKKSGTKQ
jgi:transposase